MECRVCSCTCTLQRVCVCVCVCVWRRDAIRLSNWKKLGNKLKECSGSGSGSSVSECVSEEVHGDATGGGAGRGHTIAEVLAFLDDNMSGECVYECV